MQRTKHGPTGASPLCNRCSADIRSIKDRRAAMTEGETVVKAGTYLYDGQIACDVRIVYSPTRYGSGDPWEPPEEDERRDSYYLHYGGTEHRGAFVGGGGCFDTLEDAMQRAAETMQNLVWDETAVDRGRFV